MTRAADRSVASLPADSDPAAVLLQERPPERLEVGEMVDQYKVTGELGEGGMGMVYAGVQPLIGKQVAIKVLLPELAANAAMVNRFVKEARAVNEAHSPYIVDIFAFGTLDSGSAYFVMERVDGESLYQFLNRSGPLDLQRGQLILNCVVRGLAAAHAKKIVHRDLKPENIMVLDRDEALCAKLLDFGIAKFHGDGGAMEHVTRTGVTLGTPAFMAPEQIRGEPVGPGCDIYSLGVIMFCMFTGKMPFSGTSHVEIWNKHLTAPPPDPRLHRDDLPPDLGQLILDCLAKDPALRPEATEVLARVAAAAGVQGTDAGLAAAVSGQGMAAVASPPSGTGEGEDLAYAETTISGSAAVPGPTLPPVTSEGEVVATAPPATSRAGLLLGAAVLIAVAGVAGYAFWPVPDLSQSEPSGAGEAGRRSTPAARGASRPARSGEEPAGTTAAVSGDAGGGHADAARSGEGSPGRSRVVRRSRRSGVDRRSRRRRSPAAARSIKADAGSEPSPDEAAASAKPPVKEPATPAAPPASAEKAHPAVSPGKPAPSTAARKVAPPPRPAARPPAPRPPPPRPRPAPRAKPVPKPKEEVPVAF